MAGPAKLVGLGATICLLSVNYRAAIAAAAPMTHRAPPSRSLKTGTARTASESSRPSQAAITQIQWPIHQAMSSRPSLRNSGRRVRWARNFVRRITTKAAIAPA